MELDGGNFSTVTELKELSGTVILQTESQPIHIAIDPQCNMFRRLHREEIPPTIDFILGDNDKIIVYPTGGEGSSQAAYKRLAESLIGKHGIVKADTEITETEMTQKACSFWVDWQRTNWRNYFSVIYPKISQLRKSHLW